MSFQVSPGVRVREIDLTTVVPAVSTSIGGICAPFKWGPVNTITTISDEDQLAEVYGKPVPTAAGGNAKWWFTAAQFLQYGNNLKTVRCDLEGAKNAVGGDAGSTAVEINNRDHYDSLTSTILPKPFYAKYPGELGNSLQVSVCSAGTAFTTWEYANLFDTAPGTSVYAAEIVVNDTVEVNDELHIAVVDEGGLFSGTKGTVLETFAYVSQAPDALSSDGGANFFVDVINNQSQYIWCGKSYEGNLAATADDLNLTIGTGHANGLTDVASTYKSPGIPLTVLAARTTEANRSYHVNGTAKSATPNETDSTVSLTGGLDFGSGRTNMNPLNSELKISYELFGDKETEEVNLLIAGPELSVIATHSPNVMNIADRRKDCMAFVSPATESTVNVVNTTAVTNVTTWAEPLASSSYAVFDSTALYVYDKYNDRYEWIPANGTVAGLCANVDRVADAWFSPAGYDRGRIRGITKIAFNPTATQRDELYKARVNPIVSFPGAGTILYGDKTALTRPSAFDRINVRRLFNLIKIAIAEAAKQQLFEFNDEFTRAQFRNLIEPFLRDIRGRRGIEAFRVHCDERNNPPAVVDSNRFVASIYIDPPNTINYITLNFIATRTGVDFEEIIGSRS